MKIYLHEVVLSYRCKKYYVSSLNITSQDVIRAIAGVIEYFCGFAKELIIDNPKQMVITHKKSGVIWRIFSAATAKGGEEENGELRKDKDAQEPFAVSQDTKGVDFCYQPGLKEKESTIKNSP